MSAPSRPNPTCRNRPPGITISTRRLGTVNMAALQLLVQDGEQYVAICRTRDGELYLKPIQVPEDTLTVNRLAVPARGAPRISTGNLEPGRYELVWRGDIEGAILRRV